MMQYRVMGKTGERVSTLGFGCMRIPGRQVDGKWQFEEEQAVAMFRRGIELGINYYDTAYMYSDGQNERIVGKALAGGYRDKVLLTSKLPGWMCQGPEDFGRILDEQLSRLGTDHLDFYLLHALDRKTYDKMVGWGVIPFLEEARRLGKIRYIGFSFHDDFKAFAYILKSYPWDVCQIQFNYLDVEEQATEEGLRLAGELGVPVIIMEGLRGGRLCRVPENVRAVFDSFPVKRSPTQWAFRFIADYPQVATVLSGMSSVEMVEENCRMFENMTPNCMSCEERKLVSDARAAFRARLRVNCTGCRYCMPCPSGVEIPTVFSLWNESYMFDMPDMGRKNYAKLTEKGSAADKCVGCGACEAACPQHLEVPKLLQAASNSLK